MATAPTIITVTGTKGKTTVVSVVAEAMRNIDYNVIQVTTNGHYVNGIQQSTLEDSKRIWGFKTPTLSPGRYLNEFTGHNLAPRNNNAAVLEATFACSRQGLGYYRHDVGVFLNVFDDHIDPLGSVKNQLELAQAKSFVFSKVKNSGAVVFNADDPNVCAVLSEIPDKSVHQVPCGFTFEHFELSGHLSAGGAAVTVRDGKLVLILEDQVIEVMDVSDVEWTYGGRYTPSVWNLMHSFGALYAAVGDTQEVATIARALRSTKMEQNNGRLVVMHTPNDVTVIADYAHEKNSLDALAKLGRSFIRDDGKLLGVVRLSHERPDEVIRSNGAEMGDLFDRLIVYDKIDGYWRHAQESKIKRYQQVEGKVSQLVYDAAVTRNPQVERIVREDLAIDRAAEVAATGDVVVVIVNDDARRSISHIKKAFDIGD